MAKLKAPLLSLGASGAIGESLVFFPWKGLNVVREYVIPSNPKTSGQTTQRGYLTDAVDGIHAAQTDATNPLISTDISAYALWASVVKAATTWFNQACKNWIDQLVAGLTGIAYTGGVTTPGAGELAVEVYAPSNCPTTANFKYGTSKTALINTQAATVLAPKLSATITGLTAGVKYYWQLVPTGPAGAVGTLSGIYYGTPT